MNLLDLVALAVVAVAAGVGWRMGFVRRVTSWAGLIIGLLAATWLLPRVLSNEVDPASPTRFVIAAGLLLLGGSLGHLAGSAIGGRVGVHRAGATRRVDAALGAVAGVVGAVLTFWLLLPVMADVPGWPAEAARGSYVARTIDDRLGPPPGFLDNLADTLGIQGIPRVFEDLGPSPSVAAPPPNSPVDAATIQRTSASTLKVATEACGRIQYGTGFVVAPRLVVTNAHVVAGGRRTGIEVETVEGTSMAAEAIAFDPRADLAVLRVPALDRPALPLVVGRAGDVGVALGYAGGGPLTINPFVVGRQVDAVGRDIYDEASVERSILVLGARLAPGDSGGPLVDPDGEVVGVAFAIAPDQPDVAYAVTNDQVRDTVEGVTGGGVDLGPCVR